MRYGNLFDSRPKSRYSKVGKLWAWFTKQTGHEPRCIYLNNIGRLMDEAGAPKYIVTSHAGAEYHIFEVEKAVKHKLDESPLRASAYYVNED